MVLVLATFAGSAASDETLRVPGDFDSIAERAERSRALFAEAGKVLLHPRCVNCHPAGDTPSQGMDGRPHDPPVERGLGGSGAAVMRCASCHQAANVDHAHVPGAPLWILAPRPMAWQGLGLGGVCEQMKDPRRNGNRTLGEIVEHVRHDDLVGWGWNPGAGRESAPGTRESFAALIEAWVETGAECPQ